LTDLWEIPESDREKGVKLLNKIYSNILSNPNDPKFRDLNFSKIRKKLDKCRPAFYLLYTAGFNQNATGDRLQWQNNKITMKLLLDANNGLQAKRNGLDVADNNEYGGIVDPTQTAIIKDRNMNIHRKKKEKQKLEKLQKEAEQKQLKQDLEKIDKMETEQNEAQNVDDKEVENGDDVEMDEEMKKAMAMSMEPDDENNDTSNDPNVATKDDDDVAMAENVDDVHSQLKEAGLDEADLALIEQIKAAKGITVTLKASDLNGLSKEEKLAKFKDVQNKYRKEKQQNIVKMKLDKERRRREGIKKAQEAERKRKEYEMRMVAGRKKREKAEAERRKKAIKEKIAADKKRRLQQKEREKKKKDAQKQAKLQKEQNQ